MKPNRFVTTLAFALIALAFANPLPAAAQEKVVFGLPAPYNIQFAYLWFGSKLGYFKEENMQLDVISVTGSGVLLPQVAAGQVHIGYANPDLAVIALAKNEPLPVRFVANWLRMARQVREQGLGDQSHGCVMPRRVGGSGTAGQPTTG